MTKLELKPLKLLEKENKYRISQYVKYTDLVKIDEPKLSIWKKFLKLFDTNRCYNILTNRQKRLLHTIAPLWANIIQHNLEGSMIITDDNGNRYNLNSLNSKHCLVGEVYDFGGTTCKTCDHYNMSFASLNRIDLRNSSFLGIYYDLPRFLDHYYEYHWLNKGEN